MALIVSAATGNFNAGATWVGGIVPGVGDEARASTGHTITITADVTCDELSNDGTGSFTLDAGVTLNANITNKSTTTQITCLVFSANTGTSTINGNITGGSNPSLPANHQTIAVLVSGTGATLNINGNILGSTINSGFGAFGALRSTGSSNINIVGNVTGSGANNGAAFVKASGNASVINITGNVTGGTANGAIAINVASTCTINITGTVTGGGSTFSQGVNATANGVVNITGDCYGGTGGPALSVSGRTTVNGAIYASEFYPALGGGARTQVTSLTGPFYTSPINGVNPNGALAWRWASNLNPNTFIQVPTSNLASTRNLVTPDNATNFPATSNVRSGSTYGIGGALTGTCAVPAANTVALGVPVDNTTGTANVSPADFWDYSLSSASGVSGSVGEKLKKTAIPADIIALG